MALVTGVVLAAIVGVFARLSGMDRDRAFYATVLIIVGHYYFLFAIVGGSDGRAIAVEVALFCLFAAIAVAGFRLNMWFVVAGLALHGVFDLVRHQFLPGENVPSFWPDFRMAFDVAAAAVVAGMLILQRRTSQEAA